MSVPVLVLIDEAYGSDAWSVARLRVLRRPFEAAHVEHALTVRSGHLQLRPPETRVQERRGHRPGADVHDVAVGGAERPAQSAPRRSEYRLEWLKGA